MVVCVVALRRGQMSQAHYRCHGANYTCHGSGDLVTRARWRLAGASTGSVADATARCTKPSRTVAFAFV